MTILDPLMFALLLAAAAILCYIQAYIPFMIADFIAKHFFGRSVPSFALFIVALFAVRNLYVLYTKESYIAFLQQWEVIA